MRDPRYTAWAPRCLRKRRNHRSKPWRTRSRSIGSCLREYCFWKVSHGCRTLSHSEQALTICPIEVARTGQERYSTCASTWCVTSGFFFLWSRRLLPPLRRIAPVRRQDDGVLTPWLSIATHMVGDPFDSAVRAVQLDRDRWLAAWRCSAVTDAVHVVRVGHLVRRQARAVPIRKFTVSIWCAVVLHRAVSGTLRMEPSKSSGMSRNRVYVGQHRTVVANAHGWHRTDRA